MQSLKRIALHAATAIAFAATLVATADARPVQRLTQYGHTAWRTQDGVVSAENTTVQGKDGYLWISTDTGLVRFDGVRFVPADSYANGSIAGLGLRGIWSAKDGAIWVGGSGFVVRLKDGRMTRYPIVGRLGSFAEDDAGLVWFTMTRVNGRSGPLCRVVDEKVACVGKPDLPFVNAAALVWDHGAFWISDASTLCRWSPTSPAECHHLQALEAFDNLNGITALVPARDGALWVGISRTGPGLGLVRFDHGAWKPFTLPTLDGSTLSICALFEDRGGALWIGTYDQGLYRVVGEQVDHYGSADGLTSDMVQGGFNEDREGTMWVSTSAGLDAFRRLPVSTFSVREGLASDTVAAVLPATDGTVWVSSRRLTALRDDRVVPPPAPLAGQSSTSLLEDHAGRLYVGLRDTLSIHDHGAVRAVTTADQAPPGVVMDIVEDAAHDVWIVTAGERGTLFRIHDGIAERRLADTPFAKPTSIAADPVHGIWLASRGGGLARYDGGALETILADDAGSSAIRRIAFDRDGAVLGATARGLLVQRGSLRRLLGPGNGLPCAEITAVVRDRAENLWLMSRCGLIEIRRAEWDRWWVDPTATVRSRLLDRTDGVRPGASSFTPAASVAPDGRLWFATDSVAQVVDPTAADGDAGPIPVRIEELVADHTAVDPAAAGSLPPHTRDIEIRYTALSYVTPQSIAFQYRLHGRNDTWQDAGTRRQALYTDLPPGAYRFEVRARRRGGPWSEAAAPLDFEIAPAFYQTRWFAILCIAGAALLLYAFYAMRLRQVAATVRDRLDVKNAERERIARDVHDTLLQSTQGLMLLFQQAATRVPADTPERALMEKALDRADETLVESRDRIKELRRGADGPVDLVAALRDASERLAAARGLASPPAVDVVGGARPVPAAVAQELVSIVREALQNALTHAAATTLGTRVAFDDASLQVSVTDDGVGIPTDVLSGGRPGHWGLVGMRERATRIGSRVDVRRRPEGGTAVDLVVPLDAVRRVASVGWWARWRSRSARVR